MPRFLSTQPPLCHFLCARRILGYQPPVDADAESDSEPSGDEDEAAPGDGPLDRDWIKMRAAKMLARHQRAAAAAGGAGAGAGMTGRA